MSDYEDADEMYSSAGSEAEAFEEDLEEFDDEDLEDLEGPTEELVDDPDEDPDYYDPEELVAEINYLESLSDDEDEGDLINEDMDDFLQDLRAAKGYKTKSRKSGRRAIGEAPLTPELRQLMGQVNQAYVAGDLESCRAIIEKVVQIDPGIYGAWKILGEIFKEKGDERRCLQCWIMAALSKPREIELWLQCAKMSVEIYGPGEQAVHCFSKALKYNKNNIEIMYERAMMYKEMGWNGKSVDGFKAILKLKPHDFRILRDLSRVLIRQCKVSEAIRMYIESINFYIANGNVGDGSFGWSDLNILIELYMMAKDWKNAVFAARSYARWLYGRAAEGYWDSVEKDDREWDVDDSRREKTPQYQPGMFPPTSYLLPVEIRVKLGICRMKLGNREECIRHFSFLAQVNPAEYSDLLQEAADILVEHEAFEHAVPYYRRIVDSGVYDKKVYLNLAKCYRELADAIAAEEAYWTIIKAEPTDIEARMQLAVLLEADNRREEALDLVNEIISLRKPSSGPSKPTARTRRRGRRAREEGREAEEGGEPEEFMEDVAPATTPIDSRGLLISQNPRKPSRARRAEFTAEQRRYAEEKRKEQTRSRYEKLEALRIGMEEGNEDAVKEWLDTAADLVDTFRNTRAFYPNERKTQFTGFTSAAKRRAAKQSEDVAVQRLQNRLEESLQYQEEEIQQTEDLTHFHGLDFDTWCSIFCQYALCLAKFEDVKDAYDVLLAAIDANVFYHNLELRRNIHAMQLACALRCGDSEQVSEFLRAWMIAYQFKTDVYRLFAASFMVCPDGKDKFKDGANQKFFLRQIKSCDKAVLKRDIPGASALTGKNDDGTTFVPTSHDAMLFALYGHILTGGRGYVSALSYYSRLYGLLPDNPMVAFYISLAYLNRSMQRQSSNRQWEVLQSLSFLFDYYDARIQTLDSPTAAEDGGWLEVQEAEYNIGRAFHQIGLAHLAVGFYEKALALSEKYNKDGRWARWDLRWEAAYNMQMVYFVAGNVGGADEVTEKYLVL